MQFDEAAEARRHLEEAYQVAVPHATALARMIEETLGQLQSVGESGGSTG